VTLAEAYKIHRNASRNVGRGKGYTARNLDEALKVLHEFWADNSSVYVTQEIVEAWDKAHATQ
jgi:predicted GNAT family N-acyltransferase